MKIQKTVEKNQKWGAWQGLYITIVAYVLSLVVAAVADVALGDKLLPELQKSFLVYALNTAVLLGVAIFFIRSRKVAIKKFLQLPDKSSLYLIPVYYIVYALLTLIIQMFMQLIPGYDAGQDQTIGFSEAKGLNLALVFVALVILPPIGEELIFRGILYTGLKTRTKKIIAALITSAMFGLAHMQWNVGVDTFVLSLVIIHGYERQKTLWLPIGVHAVKNYVAFLYLFVFKMY